MIDEKDIKELNRLINKAVYLKSESYWLEIEEKILKYRQTLDDKDKRKLRFKLPLEMVYMACQGIRYKKENKKE